MFRAFGLSLCLFTLCALELSARRGWDANLYLANKVLASTALLMIALSMIVGAWSRTRPYAKAFGLVGFGYAVVHVGLTLFVQDPELPGQLKFAFPDYYFDEWISIACSLTAFGIFSLLFRWSVRPPVGKPRNVFRTLTFAGVLLVLVHAVLLKYEGWMTWIETREPALPPLSLIVALAAVVIVGIKVRHLIRKRRVVQVMGGILLISVLPMVSHAQSSLETRLEETSLRTRVRLALLNDEVLERYPFQVQASAGVVTVQGTVHTQEEWGRVSVIVSRMRGVTEVVNEVQLSDGEIPDPDFDEIDLEDLNIDELDPLMSVELAREAEDEEEAAEPPEPEMETQGGIVPDGFYRIQEGDTWLKISQQFDISIRDLRRMNDLSRTDRPEPGDLIRIRPEN